jgi:hypothetical protein
MAEDSDQQDTDSDESVYELTEDDAMTILVGRHFLPVFRDMRDKYCFCKFRLPVKVRCGLKFVINRFYEVLDAHNIVGSPIKESSAEVYECAEWTELQVVCVLRRYFLPCFMQMKVAYESLSFDMLSETRQVLRNFLNRFCIFLYEYELAEPDDRVR